MHHTAVTVLCADESHNCWAPGFTAGSHWESSTIVWTTYGRSQDVISKTSDMHFNSFKFMTRVHCNGFRSSQELRLCQVAFKPLPGDTKRKELRPCCCLLLGLAYAKSSRETEHLSVQYQRKAFLWAFWSLLRKPLETPWVFSCFKYVSHYSSSVSLSVTECHLSLEKAGYTQGIQSISRPSWPDQLFFPGSVVPQMPQWQAVKENINQSDS